MFFFSLRGFGEGALMAHKKTPCPHFAVTADLNWALNRQPSGGSNKAAVSMVHRRAASHLSSGKEKK